MQRGTRRSIVITCSAISIRLFGPAFGGQPLNNIARLRIPNGEPHGLLVGELSIRNSAIENHVIVPCGILCDIVTFMFRVRLNGYYDAVNVSVCIRAARTLDGNNMIIVCSVHGKVEIKLASTRIIALDNLFQVHEASLGIGS